MTTAYSIKQATTTDVATFIGALHAANPFEHVNGVLDVLADHHEWEAEYGKWLSLGKPVGDEDGDAFNDWTEYVLQVANGEPSTDDGEDEEAA